MRGRTAIGRIAKAPLGSGRSNCLSGDVDSLQGMQASGFFLFEYPSVEEIYAHVVADVVVDKVCPSGVVWVMRNTKASRDLKLDKVDTPGCCLLTHVTWAVWSEPCNLGSAKNQYCMRDQCNMSAILRSFPCKQKIRFRCALAITFKAMLAQTRFKASQSTSSRPMKT